jgi:hypothetical protein
MAGRGRLRRSFPAKSRPRSRPPAPCPLEVGATALNELPRVQDGQEPGVVRREGLRPARMSTGCPLGSEAQTLSGPQRYLLGALRTLSTGRRKLRADGAERRVELRAKGHDDCDDSNRNAGRNQTVFDRGRAGFISYKAFDKARHGSTPRTVGCRPLWIDRLLAYTCCSQFTATDLVASLGAG